MKRFIHSDSFKILVCIAVALFLGVVLAVFSHNAASPATSAVSFVFSPLQKLSSTVSKQLGSASAAFKSSSAYMDKVAELEGELAECREKLADYEELKKRVESYEEFYEIKKSNSDYKFCYGSVISRDPADLYGSFVLNCGTKDGVEVNDPVIYGNYVVGVVKKVNTSSCVVRTLLDPRVNIGAYESGTREYGFVSGDAALCKNGLCRLSGLDTTTSIVSGGIVCTSGAGGVFPNGLIIGEVVSVCDDEVSAAFYAEVKPFSRLSEITDVFVITAFEGQGENDLNTADNADSADK